MSIRAFVADNQSLSDVDGVAVTVEGGEHDGEVIRGAWIASDATLAVELPAPLDARLLVTATRDGERVASGRTDRLDVELGAAETTVFLARAGEVAWLPALPEGLFGASLVSLGDGRFVLAGGLREARTGFQGTDEVWLLDLASPAGPPAFEARAAMPEYRDQVDEAHTERTMAASAVAGVEPRLFVLGGGADHPYDDSTTLTADVSVYDPDADAWETGDELVESRSDALAVTTFAGTVLQWGGYRGVDAENLFSWHTTFEEVDLATGESHELEDAPDGIGPFAAAGAALGADGTLVCGGGSIEDGVDFVMEEGCWVVGLAGSLVEVAALPSRRAGHALTTLADGRVLLTGGTSADIPGAFEGETGAARADAWLYDPAGGWVATGSMAMARAGHAGVALPDGDALVIGGASEWSVTTTIGDAISCVEVYDADSGTFSALAGCTLEDDAGALPGRAFRPAVAVDEAFGVLVVGGLGTRSSPEPVPSLYVP